MSETFNFNRFWTYFRYDLRQMWRSNSKPAMFLGGGGFILLLMWSFFSLVISFRLVTPPLPARICGFVICSAILQLYMTKSYGFLTDRRRGADYLMVPASTLEKYISLLAIALVVIPFLFGTVYLLSDALLCLAFPSGGAPLLKGIGYVFTGISEANLRMQEEMVPFQISIFWVIVFFSLAGIYNILFYVLCGLVFRRYKILYGLLISFVIGTVFSGILTVYLNNEFTYGAANDAAAVAEVFSVIEIFMAVGSVLLAWGIYHKLKTSTTS